MNKFSSRNFLMRRCVESKDFAESNHDFVSKILVACGELMLVKHFAVKCPADTRPDREEIFCEKLRGYREDDPTFQRIDLSFCESVLVKGEDTWVTRLSNQTQKSSHELLAAVMRHYGLATYRNTPEAAHELLEEWDKVLKRCGLLTTWDELFVSDTKVLEETDFSIPGKEVVEEDIRMAIKWTSSLIFLGRLKEGSDNEEMNPVRQSPPKLVSEFARSIRQIPGIVPKIFLKSKARSQ
eukprot:Gregarina_sp_Poly_1__1521@NODE_1382_length_4251_cov_27_651291_g926_i0_p1_GENE_NODE_1382_length_4251_cov_27_651291_g926_i0NODE_1382_length_4251_cov_27_651291_g926_i0_p1_ORF_typecomplete_len239_score34_53ATPgrasp_N/PF18130_1/0_061ydhR/PF08803_11/6_6e03ydhR/PF08803_11/0_33_NODE_1382_length_4251_cov_27_651291_g926_i034444160